MRTQTLTALALVLSLGLAACGGGGDGGTDPAPSNPTPPSNPPPTPTSPLDVPAQQALTTAEVGQVVAQAVAEARARNVRGTVAVVDRVGNVLAVFQMTGATPFVKVRPGPGAPARNVGLQNLDVPRAGAAIAKAITGAYLSSSGNAFSSRTASMIVQQSFPPGSVAAGLESGPLFGVQFSQLPCSDLSTRYSPGGTTIGPKRSPLGLSADPGGLPLYKGGVVVGGIGVEADADYGLDPNILDVDSSVDELVAVAGTSGFSAPVDIRANRISVDGTTLRYVDREAESLQSNPASAPAFSAINGTEGSLIAVRGYYAQTGTPALLAGTPYGAEASGFRAARTAEYANNAIYVLTDGNGNNRYPPSAGTDAAPGRTPLTATEVRRLLEEAFGVMTAARAQIRQPLNSRAQVTISVVDTNGAVLGIVRGPDAPMFGTDVSLQKARSAAFFSNPRAGADLAAATGTDSAEVRAYGPATTAFLASAQALSGGIAFANRSIGNIARPYYPDGQLNTPNGPLSRPITEWSPFATGLQESLIRQNLLEHAGFVLGASATDTAPRCSFLPDVAGAVPAQNRLQNGLQIFPGAVPIYRGNVLVGAIGVSGDGIDQDDMISFLGVHRTGAALGNLNNAPTAFRADQVVVPVAGGSARLRYVSCPFNPFVGSNEQDACGGK